MQERLLQFIWEYQYFNRQELNTEDGESIRVLSPGTFNPNQGPDFLGASARIGNTFWTGAVEIHIYRSDWRKHQHSDDPNYHPVILHVVWENDQAAGERDIPLLVLKHRVPKVLLGKYREWIKSGNFIPCERQVASVWENIRAGLVMKLVRERLNRKTLFIRSCQERNRGHWEETTWWLMARSFGLPVNADAFEEIARSIPYSVLLRLRQEPVSLEALLLGQAGLLDDIPENEPESPMRRRKMIEEYPCLLRREYAHLRLKYRIMPATLPVLFLRMRPAHFPAIRLSQLAALYSRQGAWCTLIRETGTPKELDMLLSIRASPYWEHHYSMGKPSSFRVKALGTGMKGSMVINTFVPLLYAYGCLRDEPELKDKAIRWLESTAAEKNAIVAKWSGMGIPAQTALDTQALLELRARYCKQKRCLDCAAGKALLSRIL